MSSNRQSPKEPLVAIMGTTGTGKSDLAVDLAVRFNGEIINADAMQMYRGLPIITNQISDEEQRGIPHHLLAMVDVDEPTWTVSVFVREASKLIREIRSRGKLPIVVGGTHYYISSLLFGNSLVDSPDENDESTFTAQLEIEKMHPILAGPTENMLEKLKEVDPVMGARWHPEDRRKIKRSLEIFLTTGKRASDIYQEQQRAKGAADSENTSWDALMFWVYANPDILKERLEKRVDKMEQNGLIGEVRTLHEHLRMKTAAGVEVDRTRGIWQSIGFKQFESFLLAEDNGEDINTLDKLKVENMELTKIATRQYARYQLRWLRLKTIPELKHHGALDYLYLLDSSLASDFAPNVLIPASNIMEAYLDGCALPKPASVSKTAKEVLSTYAAQDTSNKPKAEARLCEVCNMTLQTEDQWNKHVNGQRHRRGLKHKSRTALMATHQAKAAQAEDTETAIES
ncbi:hypothetical protein PFICI_03601 [Pestalotiopsis fici W106-1]|uniref:tRNA dimethylallyltransferase n=1 Tax=Pestalotiopsis fici (strain W106-1 / CGMCC3.15140) TaxID=1229662 RepID=W3XK05_PESFW|nr:uncharacterized protein PFICI_03601 [Pestalotiopsis fici W106-1]ETS85576.1 hypothetical protein PFICI_03601 [Pestalotiopsis fici W106-1]